MPSGGTTSPSCLNFAIPSSSFSAKRTINFLSSTFITTQQCLRSGGSESNGCHQDRVSSNIKILRFFFTKTSFSRSKIFCRPKTSFAFVFAFDNHLDEEETSWDRPLMAEKERNKFRVLLSLTN